jgi:hypothetical protein
LLENSEESESLKELKSQADDVCIILHGEEMTTVPQSWGLDYGMVDGLKIFCEKVLS